jgi:hypothetical protein
VSKKEIRRAARGAFPKAKNASAAKRRSTGGAPGNRQRTVGSGSTARRPAPGPPSLVRSLILGVIAGFLYFALIQWAIHFDGSTTATNILVGVFGTVLFTAANYFAAMFKYRRYMKSHKDSSK